MSWKFDHTKKKMGEILNLDLDEMQEAQRFLVSQFMQVADKGHMVENLYDKVVEDEQNLIVYLWLLIERQEQFLIQRSKEMDN